MFKLLSWALTAFMAIVTVAYFTGSTPQAVLSAATEFVMVNTPTDEATTADAPAPKAAPKGYSPLYPTLDGGEVTASTCTVNLIVTDSVPDHTYQLLQEAAAKFDPTPVTVNVSRTEGDLPVQVGNFPDVETAMARKSIDDVNNTMVPQGIDIDPSALDMDTDSQLHAYMHEMAHLFGLTHSDDPSALMYEYVTDGTDLTKYEIKALKKAAKGC